MPASRLRRAALPGAGFAAGLAHAAAFAPLDLWWLQPLALAAAIRLACTAPSMRSSAFVGLAFGFGWFGSGVAWLFVSMHRYGAMPAWLAAAALMLFALYLGAFAAASFGLGIPALRAALQDRPTARHATGAALLFAGIWGAGEMLRGWLFTGFPWLSSGHAHVDGPMAGLAPLVGAHGVGALTGLVAAGLALAIPPGRRLSPGPLACAILPLLIGLALLPVRWSQDAGDPIRVRLLQGNVPQQLKFDPQRSLAAMQAYAREIASEPADLIVLPETAWTLPWSHTPAPIADAIIASLRAGGIAAIGMPLPATTRRGEPTLSNSVAAIGAGGPLPWRYDKRHLVPFGEFVPPGFGWFVRMMKIPLGDFGRGAEGQPALPIRDQRLAFNICYEDIFGGELASQVREGATILVNLSNIAWFGDSHALPQHLQIARMRAIELARPMLRATNTGMTAAIGAHGQVLGVLAPHTEGGLAISLRGTIGLTPFARLGEFAPAALIAVLSLAGLVLGARLPTGAAR